MNKNTTLFLLFAFFLSFVLATPSYAAGPGEQCTVPSGISGKADSTGTCREVVNGANPCLSGEKNESIGNCVVTNGKASVCCTSAAPSTSCTALGGVCTQASNCKKVITNATSGCFFGGTQNEVCCGDSVTFNSPNAQFSNGTGTGLTGQLNYTLLEKIPGAEEAGSDLKSYLEALYKIALVLVTLSAVLMLSIGGFMYLTSAGNTAQMGNAKGVITDALIGLVIALFAWLLLYVINPDFVGGSINGLSPVSVAPGYSPAVPVSVEGQYTHAEAVAALQAQGISVTSSGNCSDQSNKTCTSLQGIPKSTVDNLIKLKQGCGCSFSVTGGTEVGHASHGTGRAVVDVSLSLRSFLLNNKGSLTSQYNVIKICATKDNQDVAMGCSYIEPQPHFHLVFKS